MTRRATLIYGSNANTSGITLAMSLPGLWRPSRALACLLSSVIFIWKAWCISALTLDYYHFDQASRRLVGEHTRKTYQLGDAVRVQVARVDLDDRKIDLEIVGEVTPGAGRRGNKKSVRRQSRASDAPRSKRSKSGRAAERRAPHSSRISDKETSDKKSAKAKGSKATAVKAKASKPSKKASKNKGAPKRRGRS